MAEISIAEVFPSAIERRLQERLEAAQSETRLTRIEKMEWKTRAKAAEKEVMKLRGEVRALMIELNKARR